jgi:RNA polymerase sigma-70 factor (ECF subfamily)
MDTDVTVITADEFLIKRLLKGDAGAFDQFFDDFFPRVFRFALTRVGGNQDLAEELAQATLCKALENLKNWRGEAALTTWLFTICRNLLTDMNRGPRGRVASFGHADDFAEVRAALESLESSLSVTPEQHSLAGELKHFVQLTLDYLPPQYATALRLKYLQGLSVNQIADHLQMTSKAAESLLTRARGAFRDGFGEMSQANKATS